MNKRHTMPLAAVAMLSVLVTACASDNGGSADGGCSADELSGAAFAPVTHSDKVTIAGGAPTQILAQDGGTVKVGWFGDLTGGTSSFTIGSKQAAQLAIEEANKAGELNVTIKFEAKDNKDASTDTAGPIEQSFIQDKAVVGVIGGAFSGETLAVGELFSDAGLTHISPSATNPDITTKGWPFFRLLSTDSVQAAKAAELINNIGCESVMVVNDKSDYGQGLADLVAEALGDKVTATEGVEPTENYSSLVSSIEAAAPDLVFYGGYGPEASLIVKQMREAGVEATFMSGDGTKDASFVSGAGAANAEGTILTCPCSDPNAASDEASAAFVTAYKERWGSEPSIYAAEGYDAGNLMVAAIDASDDDGSVTREEIYDFFNDASGLTGLTKDYTWDETGEIEGGVIIAYVVRDGAIVQLGSVDDVS